MKTIDSMKARLKPLALTATIGAAALATLWPTAQADLVGHWLSGAENLTNASTFTAVGTHDGVVNGNAGNLSYAADLPLGYPAGPKSVKLNGGVGIHIANTSSTADAGTYQPTFDSGISSQMTVAFWAKGFPGDWSPWVSKRGEDGIGWQLRRMDNPYAGFTIRGVANDDGRGSNINVENGQPAWHHYAGVWDQATGTRQLYIDGVFSHTNNSTPGDDMAQAPTKRLVLGARAEGWSDTALGSYFTGNLFDVRIYNAPLTQNEILDFLPPAVPTNLVGGPGNGKVGLSWTAVPGNTTYTVVTTEDSTNTVISTDTGITTASFNQTGLTNGTAYRFKVSATRGGFTSDYCSEITVTPNASPAKDILTFSFGVYGDAKIVGTNITKTVPVSLTNLAPTYTTSILATGAPVSGTALDFTTPQTYTITADDGSTKDYLVTVTQITPMTYNFNGNSLQGWTQIWPVPPGGLMEGDAMGTGYDGGETRFARSPYFNLTDAGPLTFQLRGGQSPLAAPNVGPSAIPELAINGGGFAGVALRDVASNTYVLSKRRNGSDGGYWQPLEFSVAELAPYANDGKIYTLDYIDYNKGGWGWTYMDNVSIPGTPATLPDAYMTSIKIGDVSTSQIALNTAAVWLPYGSAVTALTPIITVSPGATISPESGVVQDFTNPVQYTVTNGAASTVYMVSVSANGSLNVRTYDATVGAANLNPISNLEAVTPSGTDLNVAEINYGDFAASLPGLTANDNLSLLWDGWLDVTKDGAGYYTFGTNSDDGSVIYLDLNNDRDFADTGELVVNNNGDHGLQTRTASIYLPMGQVRIAIGYYNGTGGSGLDARFKRGNNVGFNDMQRISGKTSHFRATSFAIDDSASAALWNLNYNGIFADVMNAGGNSIRLRVAPGTDVTNMNPSFLIPAGATCDVASGTYRDFTTPQTYTVTPADNVSPTKTYTVSVFMGLKYEFSDWTLQGWHNRVWDLSANGGAGGWIDLDPNVTTMPATANGGVIQPSSNDNGLFRGTDLDVYFYGHTDNHLNTQWLRSPAFYLQASVDLTLQIGGGYAHSTDPTQESQIPHNPPHNGGWKGVVLRRVSDGAYLIVKRTSGESWDKRNYTFTQTELNPYVGVACTLDLVNADRGGWGFLTMDNVVIPTSGLVPDSPYAGWLLDNNLTGPDSLPGADADKDGKKNLLEFAFDTDPTNGASSEIAYSVGSVTPGEPKLDSSSGYDAVFGRLPTPNGLTYTVQFSADLDYWESNGNFGLTVLATDADTEMEAVSVPFPATIGPVENPVAPTFFRVLVTQD